MNLIDLLSGDVIESLAKSTGASKKDTSTVLATALPTLMESMASNASTKEGAKSLEKALNDHTSDDALSTMLGKIDLEDGSKILGHILGNDSDSVKSTISKKTGVDSDLTSTILSSIDPLLLSALGSEKKKSNTKADGLTDLLGSLLGKEDDSDNDIADTLFSLAGSLLKSSSKSSSKKSSKKDGIDLGDIMNLAGKLLK